MNEKQQAQINKLLDGYEWGEEARKFIAESKYTFKRAIMYIFNVMLRADWGELDEERGVWTCSLEANGIRIDFEIDYDEADEENIGADVININVTETPTQEDYYQEFVADINSQYDFIDLMYRAITASSDWSNEKKLATEEYVNNNMGTWAPEFC